MLAPAMDGRHPEESTMPAPRNAEATSASLAWAVLLLHVAVLFSILRSLEYLNVPVWEHVIRLLRAAR